MNAKLIQSREAVRRAGRSTHFLLGLSVALLVLLGVMFTFLMVRQSKLQDGIREDALWAAYQLDREARTLSELVTHLGPLTLITPKNIDDLTLRYDILYSRLSVLEGGKFDLLFDNSAELGVDQSHVRDAILAMEPFFDETARVGRVDRNAMQRLEGQFEDLLSATGNLLNHTNAAVSAVRADARDETLFLQRTSAAIILILTVAISFLLFNLKRQIATVRQTANSLENLTSELTVAFEAADAGNRTKSEFMATMGHEIRTPLNAILGMAELLLHAKLGPEERSHVNTISTSGTALLEILNEILDFAKIEHGRMTQELIAFDARRLVTDLPRIVEGRARERNNRLDVNIDELPAVAWYRSDPTLIQRVLLNLLSNAVKFTENGIVRLRAREIDDGRCLRFEVADTGIGIPLEARGRLFAAFTQVDSSISRRFGGTGLGLAICKKIVEGLGGEIGVDSTPGVGSLFWFELPVVRAEPAAPKAEEQEVPEESLPRLRILVVEDHAINRQVAGKLLGMLGQEVSFAEDGGAGVAAAAKDSYDLILMDMQMPVMDGIAATRAIREAGCTAPIVAMTANASDDDRRRCAEAGMTGFEPKPISLKRLRSLISRQARGHRPAPVEAVAAAPPPQSIPVWDEARVAELVQAVGADGHRDLTEMFLSESRAMLDAVRAAVLARDPEAMDRILHAIKGAASNIGLAGVANIAQDCRSGRVADDPEGRIAAEIARISETANRIAA